MMTNYILQKKTAFAGGLNFQTEFYFITRYHILVRHKLSPYNILNLAEWRRHEQVPTGEGIKHLIMNDPQVSKNF